MRPDAGIAYALGGLLLWGLSPLYWKQLRHVPALETLLHRVVWSALLMVPLVARRGRLRELAAALARPALAARLLTTTLLIGFNWFLYIWAINEGRLLEASLGYFINPLVNVALGVALLGERLRPRQTLAVLLAAAAVANLVLMHGRLPWVSLALALSFAFYALLRKTAPVDALIGLTVETVLLAGPSAAWLLLKGAAGQGAFGPSDPSSSALLAASSIATAVPLLWYTEGARRLDLKTLGLVQYVSPSCQFLLGLLVFREPMDPARWTSFALIWAALALYAYDAASRAR